MEHYFSLCSIRSYVWLIMLCTWCSCMAQTSYRRGRYKPPVKPVERYSNRFKPGLEDLNILLLSDLTFYTTPKFLSENEFKKSLKTVADSLSSLDFNPVVKGETTSKRQYPSALLRVLSDKLVDSQINTVFFYITQRAKSMNKAAVQYIVEMITSMGIPVMAWTFDNTVQSHIKGNSNKQVLLMSPTIRDYCQAMLGLMQHYSWDQFSILTTRLEGYEDFITSLQKMASVVGSDDYEYKILAQVIVDVETRGAAEVQLEGLKATDTRVILLYCDQDEADIIFKIAHKLDMTGKEYIWIAAQPVIDKILYRSLQAPASFPIGLLGIHYNNTPNAESLVYEHIHHALSVWASGVKNMQNAINQPNSPLANFTVQPDANWGDNSTAYWKGGPQLFEFMKNVTLDYPAIKFNEDGTSARLKLNIFNVARDKHIIKKIGSWQEPEGLGLEDITWPGNALSPPSGHPSRFFLKVVTLKEEPYVVYNDPDSKTGKCPRQAKICRIAPLNETLPYSNDTSNSSLYQCCSGLCIDLLSLLSDRMRFDYDLFQVEDGLWGAPDDETKEWNGLVKSIMDEKADMVVTSLKITPERNAMIDFSIPFLETGITIIVAVRDGVISPTAFLEPFDIPSWIFILLICIHLMALTLFIFEWLSPSGFDMQKEPVAEPYDYPSWCLILVFSVHASGAAIFIFEWLSPSGLDRGNKPIREHRFSLFRSFWLIWAMLLKATVNVDNPRGVSSRFLASIWALFAVVFTASYTANLAAFMITKEDYDKLEGIKDWRLAEPETHKPPFKFATVPSGSTETNLRKFHRDMFEYMRKYNRSSVDEGIKAVKDGQINAFIYDATVLEFKAGRDDQCKLRTVGNWYAMTGYGIGFPKNSKWMEKVNKHLVELQYEGQLERLQKYWLAGACKKNSVEGESSMPLGILNFTSAFILLAGGMLLGGFLLLMEHFYFKFFRSRLRKWDKCGCCGLVSLSMGRSLTFEQSVREAIDLQKHHKCKNPICETHAWKLKHELDLALLKIDNLQRQMGDNGIVPDRRAPSVWRNQVRGRPTPPAIGWKPGIVNPRDGMPQRSGGDPSWNSPGPPGGGGPRAIGWKPEPVNPRDDLPPGVRGVGDRSPRPSAPAEVSVYPYPPWNYDDSPVQRPKRLKGVAGEKPPEKGGEKSNRKGSKSLPNSPLKRSVTAPEWKPLPPPPTYTEAGSMGNNIQQEPCMKRTTSFPSAKDASSHSPGPRRPGDKKTRYHRGNVYVEVDAGQVEKETVL